MQGSIPQPTLPIPHVWVFCIKPFSDYLRTPMGVPDVRLVLTLAAWSWRRPHRGRAQSHDCLPSQEPILRGGGWVPQASVQHGYDVEAPTHPSPCLGLDRFARMVCRTQEAFAGVRWLVVVIKGAMKNTEEQPDAEGLSLWMSESATLPDAYVSLEAL